MKRPKIISFIIIVLALFILGCGEENPDALVIYNWGDYIDPALIEKFEQEEKVEVIYNEYATNEDLFVKLKNSTEHIDIVIPSDYMLERLIKNDLIQKIDKRKIRNYKKN